MLKQINNTILVNETCKTCLGIPKKFLNIWTPENCCSYPKIWTIWLCHRVMSQKDADGMANSVDPLIWVYIVSTGLLGWKLRIITVPTCPTSEHLKSWKSDYWFISTSQEVLSETERIQFCKLLSILYILAVGKDKQSSYERYNTGHNHT